MNNFTTYSLIFITFFCFASISVRQQREIDALKKRVSKLTAHTEQTRQLFTDLDYYEDMRRRAKEF